MSNIQNPAFTDENEARKALEAVRWPDGPVCPHCGNVDQDKIAKGQGKVHRPGLFYCAACNDQFTVTVGTVMEHSKIPLSKWWMAMHLLGSSKSAWFLTHRIREAMKPGENGAGPLGGEGKIVEADETYHGRRETPKASEQRKGRPYLKRKKPFDKRSIVALVERGGETRMFHVENATKAQIRDVLVRNVDRKSALHTDESAFYTETGKEFADHRTVKHSAHEYVRYETDAIVHSNTVENVFSVFKRGMTGIYQHCGEAHLHRYLSEFEFRYNRRSALGFSDGQRTLDIAKGIEGKRLTYRRIGEAPHA